MLEKRTTIVRKKKKSFDFIIIFSYKFILSGIFKLKNVRIKQFAAKEKLACPTEAEGVGGKLSFSLPRKSEAGSRYEFFCPKLVEDIVGFAGNCRHHCFNLRL